MSKPTILFINHKERQCGVQQYGRRCGHILKKSINFNFVYVEADSEAEYFAAVDSNNPIAIIYNWFPITMGWIGPQSVSRYPNITHYSLYHEEYPPTWFNYLLMVDSTLADTSNTFSVPRPLAEDSGIVYTNSTITTIGSFGFGFGNKGFSRIVRMVNDQFDEAIIRFHTPRAFFGDRDGERSSPMMASCYQQMSKPNIKLEFSTEFLDDTSLLNFLASNTINMFLYDPEPGRGLSSVMDYIMCINKPLAISNSNMFRHVLHTAPSLYIGSKSIKEIIEAGNGNTQTFREKWSHQNFIARYETIINSTLK